MITITLTRYKEPNWLLNDALFSLSNQKQIHARILVLDQSWHQEICDYCRELTSEDIIFEYIIIEPKSLSYARNYAIKLCKTDILLYIDTDAVVDEYWAYKISKTFERDNKIGLVGPKILPKFHKKPPFLIKADFVYDIYSLLDLGNDVKETRKIIGASFGIHIKRVGENAYFDEGLGRRPGKLLGGEESDLSERVIKHHMKIFYNGETTVLHQVLPERLNSFWIFKRLYWGGYNRGLAGGLPETNSGTGRRNIRNYIIFALIAPVYVLGYLKGKYHGGINK